MIYKNSKKLGTAFRFGRFAAVTSAMVLAPVVFAFAQVAPTVNIQSLSNTSVPVGTEVTFSVASNGFNGSQTYVASDSFGGATSLTSGAVNPTSGVFVWTPTSADVGTHTITITATDSTGATAATSQQITVTGQGGTVTIQSLSPGSTVSIGMPVSFSAIANGFTNPSYTATDSFGGSFNSADINNSTGVISWTPAISDVGTHTINVVANDTNGNTSSASQTITVTSPYSVSVQSLSNASVTPGQAVMFTAVSSGLSNPTYSISDSFGGTSASSVDINSSGAFSWTPTASDIGTHTLTITGTDASGATAMTTQQIVVIPSTVIAPPPATPVTTQVYTFTASLAMGSTGDDVTALQNFLIAKGYMNVAATGYYGPVTAAAVADFQTANGVEAVGVVGPQTRALLNQLDVTTSTSTSADQTELQMLEAELAQLESELAALQAAQQ